MTQASPLSRLEKLAEERYPDDVNQDGLVRGLNRNRREAHAEGGKALLQILSEPGEACGPRVWIRNDQFGPQKSCFVEASLIRQSYAREFAPIEELLQARAATERVQSQFDEARRLMEGHMETMRNAEARIASSEARVRILSEALQNIGCHTLAGVLRVENGRDNCLDATALDNIVRQALLEVKR